MEKLLIRPAEAAQILALGRSRVYELIADGTIPSVRIGRSIRVPIKELRMWLNNQRVKPSGGDIRQPLRRNKEQ